MRRVTVMVLTAVVAWTHAAAAQSRPATSAVRTIDVDSMFAGTRAANARDAGLRETGPFDAKAPFTPADLRVIVSVQDRRLWVVARGDTIRSALVSVASGRDFTFAGRRWRFATPRGQLTVKGKRTDPVWLPPDWHYAEVASTNGLKLKQLPARGVRLPNGSRVLVRDSVAGLVMQGDTTFLPLPVDEHIVFDSTLYIPPVASYNRRLTGELGPYALDLGNGYLLHGTNDQRSVGIETTHGCIRLTDADLEWLYENIPVGTMVQVK